MNVKKLSSQLKKQLMQLRKESLEKFRLAWLDLNRDLCDTDAAP